MITARLPYLPPEAALAALASAPGLVFLDSAMQGDVRSRISYLCFAPIDTISLTDNPFAVLRRRLDRYRPAAKPAGWPFPFAGGAVGWIGYDLAREAAGVASRFAPVAVSAARRR